MVFGLYATQVTNSLIRYKDGVYDLILAPGLNEADHYDYIGAIGQPCDQSWADHIQKENLIANQAMAQILYNVPDGVTVITTLEGATRVTRKLKDLRLAAGLTQTQLADASGVNIRQIQSMESGKIKMENVTAKNLLAIADTLGVDPHGLIK